MGEVIFWVVAAGVVLALMMLGLAKAIELMLGAEDEE